MMQCGTSRVAQRVLLAFAGALVGLSAYAANARWAAGDNLPMPFGMGMAVVMSGSMEPTLSTGDLVFVRAADAVAVSDIVVFQTEGRLVVHRVVATDGNVVVTRGDANDVDDAPITASAIKGVVVARVPVVGVLVQALRTPAGIIATVVAAGFFAERSRPRQRGTCRPDEDDAVEKEGE